VDGCEVGEVFFDDDDVGMFRVGVDYGNSLRDRAQCCILFLWLVLFYG